MYKKLLDAIKNKKDTFIGRKLNASLKKISSTVNKQQEERIVQVDKARKNKQESEDIIEESATKKSEVRNNFGGVYNEREMKLMEDEADDTRFKEEDKEELQVNEISNAEFSKNKIVELEDILDENDTALADKKRRNAILKNASSGLDKSARKEIQGCGKKFQEGIESNNHEVKKIIGLENELSEMKISSDPEREIEIQKDLTKETNATVEKISPKKKRIPTLEQIKEEEIV